MKTVGNYDFVIACWIAQDRPEARTPCVDGSKSRMRWRNGESCHTGSRMFFKGDTIYSYHEWWPLARLLPGRRALVNRDKYSVTTSKHESMVSYALRRAGFQTFDTSGILQSPNYLYNRYVEQYQKTLKRQNRILYSWAGLPAITEARRAYLEFCREFNYPVEFDLTRDQWKQLALRYKKYYDRRKLKQFANKLLYGKESYA